MIDTPHLTQSDERLTAMIHLVVPRSEIQHVMGPAIQEVYAAIGAQGLQPAGPWFTYHARRPGETFDLEISVPIASPIAPVGRVKPGKLRAAKVARTVYHGPYEGLGDGWGEFMDWLEANGHKEAEDLWECYLVGPETSSNPADWRTELNRPLTA